MPLLPNFLVGGILQDKDPTLAEGHAQFEREAPMGEVTPLGVGPSSHYRFVQSLKRFGQAEILRCPYYIDQQGGLCGIWRYRESVCSTWFCKFERASISFKFWDSARKWLSKLQVVLAIWSADQLGLHPTAKNPNLHHWNQWLGREREFYVASFGLVSSLSWKQIQDIGGTQIQPFTEALKSSFQQLRSDKIPERLLLQKCNADLLPNDQMRIVSYSLFDSIDLHKTIFDLLPRFDGRPWVEVVHAIQEETEFEMDVSLIRKLWEYGILAEK